jgi:hypothetical protein
MTDLLATGDDPEERRDFDNRELKELPEFMRRMVEEHRESEQELMTEQDDWDDDEW